MFDLRRELMAHLQKLDIAFFDRNPVGRLVTRVTTDVDTLNELFTSGLVTIIGDVLMLSFVVVAMLNLSPGMTGLLLAVLPLVVLVTAVFRRTVQQSYRRIRVAIARINAYLQEHINGIAVLQLFNREAKSLREFDRINRDHMDAYKDAITAYGWFYPVVEFLGMLALASLLAYGGFRIRQGALSLGILVAFFQYGLRFFRPIQDLSEKYNILQAAMAAGERIFKLLDTSARISTPPQPAPFPSAPAAIEFDHVWFAYKDEDWVLRDVSFRVEPGETIAVVGPYRRRQDHADQPAAAFLRRAAGQRANRRRRRAGIRYRGAAPQFRSRAAGPAPIHRHHCQQYSTRHRGDRRR